jgi:hypothetical protein
MTVQKLNTEDSLKYIRNYFANLMGSYITGSFGAWRSPKTGEVYSDISTLFIVTANDNERTFEYFNEYRKILEKNLRQEKVMITYYPVC